MRFSSDGRYILSRDYLTLKIWDVNYEKKPFKTIPIHDSLKTKLCDLYEGDYIFDKFECTFSGDAKSVLTGSYSNYFMIYPMEGDTEIVLQADKSAFKAKKVSMPRPRAAMPSRREQDVDFTKKILHGSWHPHEDSIAIAATNNVSPFTESPV